MGVKRESYERGGANGDVESRNLNFQEEREIQARCYGNELSIKYVELGMKNQGAELV